MEHSVSVLLCNDILLEVLQYLTRRQILKLESTGGRIHRIVGRYLKREPYLIRLLVLEPGFFSHEDGLVAKICKSKFCHASSIPHRQLRSFLRCCEFLRFEKIKLSYDGFGYQSIDKNCQLFVKHLKPLAAAFSGSTKIHFNANIGRGCFRDPLHLLNHLRNKLLPICDSARHYEFSINFFSYYESSATDILKSILQMPSINCSTNVEFNLHQSLCALNLSVPPILTQLPVDTISAWLNRSNDVIIKCKKQQQKTKLELKIDLDGVQNAHELLEHLKKTFNKAESPRQPFSFYLHSFFGTFEVQSELLSNEKTNEELSIDANWDGYKIQTNQCD